MEDLNPSEISKIIKDRINKLDVSAEESNEAQLCFLLMVLPGFMGSVKPCMGS